ncbi:MAG TPA: Glu/Leu/Phe/Val dehydrogenase dimerization domain-containing protein [Longimicrobiales bacterium]|nr:Glu/Leu/Phe/Val dehydrogenase dimerization domain-containing protein [Longimicrobiales bacterium]
MTLLHAVKPNPVSDVWQRYSEFLRQPPELTFAWHDAVTGARAWLIINSLRGGAAGGGTRMRVGCDPREVAYLAKAMELKFAISGPAIGGAKTGIDFDPSDARKTEVLERWYRAIAPYLRERYGTGGDLGIDEITDVLPAFARLGLRHPQEGVVRGHLAPPPDQFDHIVRKLDAGVAAPAESASLHFTVADVVTGFGVAQAIAHYYRRCAQDLSSARVLLEGFGNVGAACALYLARTGARVVAIRDAQKVLLAPDGLSAQDVEQLIATRNGKLLPNDDVRVVHTRVAERFLSTRADVFVCAAISGSIDESVMTRLSALGVRTIACGANQPFAESKMGSTRVAQYADQRFAILPDILANLGMARTFSYLMEPHAQLTAHPILSAVESTITATLDQVLARNVRPDAGLLAGTLGLALDRVDA